jgi:hypothetical protein
VHLVTTQSMSVYTEYSVYLILVRILLFSSMMYGKNDLYLGGVKPVLPNDTTFNYKVPSILCSLCKLNLPSALTLLKPTETH